MDLIPLAQYGVVGLCVGFLVLFGVIIKYLFDFMKNHIKHNTEAMEGVKNKLGEDIEAQKETSNTLRELKDYLMLHNGNKK